MFGEERNVQMPHRSLSQSPSFLYSHFLLNLANEAASWGWVSSFLLWVYGSSPMTPPTSGSKAISEPVHSKFLSHTTRCPELACWHNFSLQITKWTYSKQIPTQTAAGDARVSFSDGNHHPPGRPLRRHLWFLSFLSLNSGPFSSKFKIASTIYLRWI